MIETNAFLAMFTMQILVGSVLSPEWLIRRVRARVAAFPDERFAQLFPGVDKTQSGQRFVTWYRALNTVIALVGLVLLTWLFVHMRRPDWNQGKVPGFLTFYLLAQMSPLVVIGVKGSRSMKMLRASRADAKRTALLQRRGLFDFISPLAIILAALSYALLVALVFYIRQHPFPGFGGFTNLAVITPIYALNAFVVYGCLYGKNRNPVATHADRIYMIGVIVKCCVYSCIAVAIFASLILTLSLLHLKNWELFALSVFFVISTFISPLGVIPRRQQVDALGSNGPLPPGTPDLSA